MGPEQQSTVTVYRKKMQTQKVESLNEYENMNIFEGYEL